MLLDSLVAQRADGTLVVGRGVPAAWLDSGQTITVSNYPTTAGRRTALDITARGRAITLTLRGGVTGQILFQIPLFVNSIASSSTGHVDRPAVLSPFLLGPTGSRSSFGSHRSADPVAQTSPRLL